MTRYTSRARNVAEVISRPSDISSAAETVTSREVDFSRSTSMVLVPGSAWRTACGSTTWPKMPALPSPSASPASVCPACTPPIAERKISER